MFLHLGGDVEVSVKEVIAIFSIETMGEAEITSEFLQCSEEEGFLKRITDDAPKSFVITERNKQSTIYLSPISCATLQKRTEFFKSVDSYYIKPNK